MVLANPTNTVSMTVTQVCVGTWKPTTALGQAKSSRLSATHHKTPFNSDTTIMRIGLAVYFSKALPMHIMQQRKRSTP